MTDGLSQLIQDIEAHPPNENGTFAGVLGYLRELRRMRAAFEFVKDMNGVDNDYQPGWQACVFTLENVGKSLVGGDDGAGK